MNKILTPLLVLLILVVLVFGFILVKNQYRNFMQLRSGVKLQEETLKIKNQELADLKALEKNYTQASKEAVDALQALPSPAQIAELLIQLEALAKESGMGFASLGITKEETAGKAYQTLVLTLKVSGTYKNLKTYLDAVEKNLRILDISSIDFSATPISPEGPKDVFEYTVLMRTYYIE